MIAYCKHCGNIFDSKILTIKDSENITFIDCVVKCPFCPELANLLNGSFDFDANGNVKILSAPQLTYDIIHELKALAKKAKKENYTKKQFVKEANSISPNLGSRLSKFAPKSFEDIFVFLMFVLGLLQYLENKNSKPPPSNNVRSETNIYTFEQSELKKENFVRKKKVPNPYKKKRK
ncbi:MAG: hypothetical protein ACSLE0_01380 [Chitinophagaceae bacterium]